MQMCWNVDRLAGIKRDQLDIEQFFNDAASSLSSLTIASRISWGKTAIALNTRYAVIDEVGRSWMDQCQVRIWFAQCKRPGRHRLKNPTPTSYRVLSRLPALYSVVRSFRMGFPTGGPGNQSFFLPRLNWDFCLASFSEEDTARRSILFHSQIGNQSRNLHDNYHGFSLVEIFVG